jgi:glycosyltransferase involved in cell wall biosynthesis
VTTLRVIIDDLVEPAGPTGRYAEELTRALIATAPRGTDVAGVVAASPDSEYERIEELLPGLRKLHKSALARRELTAAWHRGFTRLPGTGMVHATSLLAPLSRHDRLHNPGEQTVVTIHDALPWTHPDLVPPRRAGWIRAMARRAEKHADAVVVPSHAVADDLEAHLALGDRIRVIGAAPTVRPSRVSSDPESAPGYVLAVLDGDPRNGFEDLLGAAERMPGVQIVVADRSGALGEQTRVRVLPAATDTDLAVAFAGAAVYVQPDRAIGFGDAMLDAFALGVPVVHSSAPALVEVAADAGLAVELDDPETYPVRLADAVLGVLEDRALAERLAVAGSDRAGAYTWRDAAEKVWHLHADL